MLKADISLQPNKFKKSITLGTREFSYVFSFVNKKVHTENFSYLLARRYGLDSKIGIIATKRKVKGAVQRNLCRRLNKEMFRKNKHLFKRTSVIVIVSHSAAYATRGELWFSINKFLEDYAQLSRF